MNYKSQEHQDINNPIFSGDRFMDKRKAYLTKLVLSIILSLSLATAFADDAKEVKVVPDGNLLRNGSFELGYSFNGAAMRQGSEGIYFNRVRRGKCATLPVEGWMVDGPDAVGVVMVSSPVHSGQCSLRLTPAAGRKLCIFTCPEVNVKKGPVVLSAWVKGNSAKLKFELLFSRRMTGGNKAAPKIIAAKKAEFKLDSQKWQRLEVTGIAPDNAGAMVKISVTGKEAVIDDVQFESGVKAAPFSVRKAEILELSFRDVLPEILPFWTVDTACVRHIVVKNASQRTVTGALELFLGPWYQPERIKAAQLPDIKLMPGQTLTVPVKLSGLVPDAYVISAILKNGNKVEFDGTKQIAADTLIGGACSNHMLTGRGAIRFGLFPDVNPKKLIGVGNGKLPNGWKGCNGNWWSGWPLVLFKIARANGFICGRDRMNSPDQAYLFAAAGVPFHRMERQNIFFGAPKGSSFIVPGTKNGVDLWNPAGSKFNLERATQVGKENAANPGVVSYQMANEIFFTLKNGLCPTKFADAAFRDWCRKRYGSIENLNKKWGTAYGSWDEVEQPLSEKRANEVAADSGKSGYDWLAAFRRLPPNVLKLMNHPVGRGMDWLRWRTASTLKFYSAFKNEAKKYDKKTLYSTNLCWPNFRSQMFIPFLREMDHALLDARYTSGIGGMGNPREMMEILEMTESTIPDKPIWGAEIYVQPQYPAEFAALQNWGMLAHGMSNILVFAWGPKSDHGAIRKTQAWKDKNAHPMWMIIDWDGTKLPAYYTCQRSLEEIKKFNKKYDALTLARQKSDIAVYLSNDTAEYICMETGDKPWRSTWCNAHTTLVYMLRMAGIRFDIVDDSTLPGRPGRYSSIIIPASYVLSQAAANKIASFAANGGTVVLDGPSGVCDPWLKQYKNLGGQAWSDLNWTADMSSMKKVNLDFAGAGSVKNKSDQADKFVSYATSAVAKAKPVKDAGGQTIGWLRPWGKGRLLAYRIFPASYNTNPHETINHRVWLKQLITKAGLKYSGRWCSSSVEHSSQGFPGEGQPVVEVVTRERKGNEDHEKFVFILNQGGAGSGQVELPFAADVWQAVDALTGKPIQFNQASKGIVLPLKLKPWEYRILQLTRK